MVSVPSRNIRPFLLGLEALGPGTGIGRRERPDEEAQGEQNQENGDCG